MKTRFLLTAIIAFAMGTTLSAQTFITQVKPAGSKFWGYSNLKGEMIIPAQFEKCYKFSPDGYATIYDTKAKQYYFINTKGEKLTTEITSFKIRDGFGFDVDGFVDGMIGVRVGEKWGFLSSTGKLAIPAKFDEVNEFRDGYANGKIGGMFYILNTKGEETKVDINGIIELKSFSENLAPYRAVDKKVGFAGVDGKVAIPAQFESVGYFSNGIAWAKIDGKLVGYINTKGEWVVQPKFAVGKDFDESTGLARIKTTEGAWAYVNKTGEITYVTDTEAWGDFNDGLAEGKKAGKNGFYNKKGEWTVAPQFEGTRDFKNGYAAAKLGDKWGIIDTSGKWVMQPSVDGIKDMEKVK